MTSPLQTSTIRGTRPIPTPTSSVNGSSSDRGITLGFQERNEQAQWGLGLYYMRQVNEPGAQNTTEAEMAGVIFSTGYRL